jgi:general stress protein YciG
MVNDDATKNAADTDDTAPDTVPAKKRRGFAVMDKDKVREIASKGGKAAHAQGTAHEFSREEAVAAGRKGGIAAHKRRGRSSGTTT